VNKPLRNEEFNEHLEEMANSASTITTPNHSTQEDDDLD